MRELITTASMWIAAITLAISVGGNLFQATVVDPAWSGAPPDSVRTFAGSPYAARTKRFHTHPLYLAGLLCLLASPWLAWNVPPVRDWLLVGLGCYVAVFVWTLLYFWPMNNTLFERGGEGADGPAIVGLVRRWIVADRYRSVVRLAALLCVLRAMVLSGRVLPR